MWELDCEESWAPKNSALELWCWRRLLRVPLTERRSNQSILKEIHSGCSLEGLMLKLKLQYFGHLMRIVNSLEKTLMLGGIGGRRRRGRQRMRWLDGITDSMDVSWVNSRSWWWTGRPSMLRFWGHKESDMTERLDWTELKTLFSAVGHPFWIVKFTWSGQKLKKFQFKNSTVEENIMMRLHTRPRGRAVARIVSELALTQSPFWKWLPLCL